MLNEISGGFSAIILNILYLYQHWTVVWGKAPYVHNREIFSLMPFSSQFKFDWNFGWLQFHFWHWYCYQILHMLWQHSCTVWMSKMKFPLHCNCDGKAVSQTGPSIKGKSFCSSRARIQPDIKAADDDAGKLRPVFLKRLYLLHICIFSFFLFNAGLTTI